MALIGVSITKRVAFRDSTQEFSNVYHYTWAGLNPSAGSAESILDALVALEKARHGAGVSFVFGRVWSAGGGPGANQMIFQEALAGVGTLSAESTIDRERAVLIQWDCGTDSLGRVKRLKKWYHLLSTTLFGATPSSSINANTTGFSDSQRATMGSNADEFTSLTASGFPLELCSPSGEVATGPATAHRYYEHHQLGDQWRG